MIHKVNQRFAEGQWSFVNIKMYYKAIQGFSVVADDPANGIRSQSISIPEDHIFSVVSKQKDMFDSNIEYWTNRFGWIFKIERHHLELLEEQS